MMNTAGFFQTFFFFLLFNGVVLIISQDLYQEE